MECAMALALFDLVIISCGPTGAFVFVPTEP
jgi:hypothetical protein